MTSTQRGKGVRCMWTSTQRTNDLLVKREFFNEKTKKSHQKFWQMKYRKFARQILKIRKTFEKRGHFFGRHVDVHKGEWSGSSGQGRGQNPIFVWTSEMDGPLCTRPWERKNVIWQTKSVMC